MPFDQQLELEHSKPAVGISQKLYLLGVGACCLLLAAALPQPTLRLALGACGSILAALATGFFVAENLQHRAGARLRAIGQNLLKHDLGIGFVTDSAGVITYANAAAQDRFGAADGRGLMQIFGTMLANPGNVLSQLRAQAKVKGAQTEDIVTRGGHFRLRLLIMGRDCHLWWLDEIGKNARSGISQNPQAGFAMLTATADGQIVRMNEPCKALVGGAVSGLNQLFDTMPIRSGHVHKISTLQGRVGMTVALIEAGDDLCDIYLLPGSKAFQLPPQLEADWDAIEDLPVPLLKIAKNGNLLGSNREARKLLRFDTSKGRHLSDVLDGPGRPINDWLAEALSGQAGHVSQFLHGRGEQQDTFVQVTLNTAGKGEDLHLIAVLNDVTELKTLEAQFVQSQKMQAIGQLAGGVAHDFNNLLTAISGHCELLLYNCDESDQSYGDLMQINQNTNRAASLVGQLLAFSRKQNLQPETIDLRDTLSDLTHLLNRLVGEKVTLTLDHDAELSRIQADKRQLEQVLMNLVVNARDAMDGAGEIRVITKNLHLKSGLQRDRATVPPGEYVSVKVIDTGNGIAPEKLGKIFEPFFTTKRTGEGTGLGLSTAYGIVKQTGGYIFVDTEVGKGTTFSLLFPKSQPKALAATLPYQPRAAPLRTSAHGVVLLVEDEAPVRAFASRALRLRGYTVIEADCAEAALTLLESDELHVDVFVTDVIMPGMDGPTWVRRALQIRPDTKVVFVSGYPEDAFDDGEPEVMGAAFLPKPFSLKALTDTVQAQIQQVQVAE